MGHPLRRLRPYLLEGDAPRVDALEQALSGDAGREISALFLEPIQGEGGVVPATTEYLQRARALTSEAGALLVLDEIQTGIARTGAWFAFQRAGI